jgi:hypothetical protein
MTSEMFQEITGKFRHFILFAITGILDSLYLLIWAFFQWLFEKFLTIFNLSGFDAFFIVVLKILFAISSLVPIVIFMYHDNRKLWIKESSNKGSE